mmetsp:Transcript_83072/g.240410  ORF Transcript_83072/g.240410 Transcript_83072/m.240410 type:complete len:247 (-) Transcript_83072:1677-2417(-)
MSGPPPPDVATATALGGEVDEAVTLPLALAPTPPPPAAVSLFASAPAMAFPDASRRIRGNTERMYSPSLNWMSILPFVRFARTVTHSQPKFVWTLMTSPTCTSGRGCFDVDCAILAAVCSCHSPAPPDATAGGACASASPAAAPRRRPSAFRGRELQPATRRSTTSRSCSGVRLGVSFGASDLLASPLSPRFVAFSFASSFWPASSSSKRSVSLTVRREVPPMSISQILMAASCTAMYSRSASSEG